MNYSHRCSTFSFDPAEVQSWFNAYIRSVDTVEQSNANRACSKICVQIRYVEYNNDYVSAAKASMTSPQTKWSLTNIYLTISDDELNMLVKGPSHGGKNWGFWWIGKSMVKFLRG